MRAIGLVGPVRPVGPVAPVRPHPPVRPSKGTGSGHRSRSQPPAAQPFGAWPPPSPPTQRSPPPTRTEAFINPREGRGANAGPAVPAPRTAHQGKRQRTHSVQRRWPCAAQAQRAAAVQWPHRLHCVHRMPARAPPPPP
eukprot:gene18182-biopygen20426